MASRLEAARSRLLPGVEAGLQAILERRPVAPTHYGMMRYHLGWVDERLSPIAAPSGKRLRPLICLLAAEACHAPQRRAVPAAVALELLHNFTLIHDDIEDGDELRHHRPTVWKLWGEPQAINAGDGMHVLAYLALLDLADHDVPPERITRLTARLAETSLVITEGQHLDISFEKRTDVRPAEYLDMIGRKSAALIGCAAVMGAEVAGASVETCNALERFGIELGLGFQIRDDVLGIWGATETTGKPAGDLRRRKKTLPTLYAMSRCSDDERDVFACLFEGDEPVDSETVRDALGVLERYHAREHCETMVGRYSTAAREQLLLLPPTEARLALEELVAQLETREF
ncbi:MAG TPA: polyprenyl synthetase family protein [Chloroflexota bacterium]|nr:polyprenyl synthetase family protein [Chloroflexota bacterium]